jgi:gliding motility-associated-like protein
VKKSAAQYISRSEPVPYVCPTVCQGGTLLLKVNQIENLQVGCTVQAQLSNATGGFGIGAQIIEASEFSTNLGTTWQNGPYVFSSNINNLYMRIILPIATPAGNQYTIRMRASTGYTSNDLYQCGGNNTITITNYIPPLPGIDNNTSGNGQWFGQVYTWTPSTGGVLSTSALVNAQDFFNTTNYVGHVIYNALSFDVNLSSTGGIPGTMNNGTSIDCGNSYLQNFSMRILRTEDFAPGFYQFSIQGDDGIRFSLDGGSTWILSSWLEQQYSASLRSTNTAFPNGICLSGPTNLVIEYFQRPADARITFNATPIGAYTIIDPVDASVCAGDNVSFTVGNITGLTAQWYISTNNGITFQQVQNDGVFDGASTGNLNINMVSALYDDALFYCEISGGCGSPFQTGIASLNISALPSIVNQPINAVLCAGQPIVFEATSNSSELTYQWQVSTDGGITFSNVPNAAPYSGGSTPTLSIATANNTFLGNQYQLLVNGCGSQVSSDIAEIIPGAIATITLQPVNVSICENVPTSFTVNALNATGYQWQMFDGNGWVDLPEDLSLGFSNTQTNELDLSGLAVSSGTITVRCIISGGCNGNAISNEAILQIYPDIVILNETISQTACVGNSAGFSINATGENVMYQWQISNDGGITFTNLTESAPFSQVNTDFLAITNVQLNLDGSLFRCIVNGTCGVPIFTSPAMLSVTSVPQITLQPQNATSCSGTSVSFSADATGFLNWQWEVSSDGGLTYQLINNGEIYSGVSSNTLSISSIDTSMNEFLYRAVLQACGTIVNSSVAALNVLPNASIEDFIPPPPICVGENASYTVITNNATSFQWEIDNGVGFSPILEGGIFSGVTSPTLQINGVTSNFHAAEIRCIVVGICDTIQSSSALLFVKGIPVLISEPTISPICAGSSFVLPIVAVGEAISYRWEILNGDGTFEEIEEGGISGVNSASLQIVASSELDNIVVRCVLEGCGNEIITDSILISILQNDPVFIPSAFTPDEDPLNPEFKIYTNGDPKIDATIYNRWGEELYHWNKAQEGWDGRYMNADVPDGIYVYRVQVETACEVQTYMGTVSLFR